MARELRGLDITLLVSPNATSIAQYAAVSPDSSGSPGDVIYPAGNTTPVIGVCQSVGGPPTPGGTIAPANTPGQDIAVRVSGITKMLAGAALATPNVMVAVDSSGRAVAAAAQAATSTYIVGLLLTTAAAAGDLVEVLLMPGMSQIVNA